MTSIDILQRVRSCISNQYGVGACTSMINRKTRHHGFDKTRNRTIDDMISVFGYFKTYEVLTNDLKYPFNYERNLVPERDEILLKLSDECGITELPYEQYMLLDNSEYEGFLKCKPLS